MSAELGSGRVGGGAAAAGPYCAGCGRPAAGDHADCARRQRATDPPRFCVACGRKLVVQVLPLGWRARCVRCGELPASPFGTRREDSS